MTTVDRPGSLGRSVPYLADGTATSDVFVAGRSDRIVSLFVTASSAGQVVASRIDQTGERRPLGLPVAVAANVESRIVIDFPFGAVELEYENTDSTAGLASFEVRTIRSQ